MILNLGPEYDDMDLDLEFCRRDWEIIIHGLRVLSASTEDKKLSEDANTIRTAILDQIVEQSEDDMDWREAYRIARSDMKSKGMDYDGALQSLGCFMDQTDYDKVEAGINWKKDYVDQKLAAFRDQYAEVNSKIYSIIEKAVIYFESRAF